MRNVFAGRTGILVAGGIIGLTAALLQYAGNPANMGICVACFVRDIAGALGLHRAEAVQYLRPELPAFILGSLGAALATGEFRARAGSAPATRFFLGMCAMAGALVFLGCPLPVATATRCSASLAWPLASSSAPGSSRPGSPWAARRSKRAPQAS